VGVIICINDKNIMMMHYRYNIWYLKWTCHSLIIYNLLKLLTSSLYGWHCHEGPKVQHRCADVAAYCHRYCLLSTDPTIFKSWVVHTTNGAIILTNAVIPITCKLLNSKPNINVNFLTIRVTYIIVAHSLHSYTKYHVTRCN